MQRVLKLRSPVWICVGTRTNWIHDLPSENSWPVPGDTCYGEEFENICRRYLAIYPLKSWDQKFWVTRHSFSPEEGVDIDAYLAVLPAQVIKENEVVSWVLDHPWTPWTTKNAWLVTDESWLKNYTRDRIHHPRDRVFHSLWDIAKEMTLKDESNKHKEED